MPRAPTRNRGFTLIELAVAVGIGAIIAALAFSAMSRARPRAELAGVATELHAVVHRARQEALARGRDVAVIFYPAAATSSGTGRILVIADETPKATFMAGGTVGALDYCTMTAASHGDPLDQLDLPNGLQLTKPVRTAAFAFPFNNVPTPDAGCSFCTGTAPGGGARGAIRFDARGRAALYGDCGNPGAYPNGGSVALTNAELGGSRVLAVLPSGGIRTFSLE